jgi:peptidoglycan/LPS O-acetylase OafA/YrhL
MLVLLGTLVVALFLGKTARRITPAVELVLLVLIAVLAAVELASWSSHGAGPKEWLRDLFR